MSHGGNYQECITAILFDAADDLAVQQDEDGDGDVDMNDHILTSVDKVNQWLFLCAY